MVEPKGQMEPDRQYIAHEIRLRASGGGGWVILRLGESLPVEARVRINNSTQKTNTLKSEAEQKETPCARPDHFPLPWLS